MERCGFFYFQYGFTSSINCRSSVSDRDARAFNRSGATQAVGLDQGFWHTGFGILLFFTNLSFMEFQVRHLASLLLFPVIDDFKWFRMGSLHKNIQLMLEFLKATFLVLHFSYYISMAFMMMLSVMLLSMLVILLSTLL